MAAILPGHFKRIAAVMQPLSAQERRTLTDLLGKIIRHSTGYVDPAAPSAVSGVHAHV